MHLKILFSTPPFTYVYFSEAELFSFFYVPVVCLPLILFSPSSFILIQIQPFLQIKAQTQSSPWNLLLLLQEISFGSPTDFIYSPDTYLPCA